MCHSATHSTIATSKNICESDILLIRHHSHLILVNNTIQIHTTWLKMLNLAVLFIDDLWFWSSCSGVWWHLNIQSITVWSERAWSFYKIYYVINYSIFAHCLQAHESIVPTATANYKADSKELRNQWYFLFWKIDTRLLC